LGYFGQHLTRFEWAILWLTIGLMLVSEGLNTALEKAVNANQKYIKSETLTETLDFSTDLNNGIEIEFDSIKTRILISK
jgi:isoleucyl-tRNA synthetase